MRNVLLQMGGSGVKVLEAPGSPGDEDRPCSRIWRPGSRACPVISPVSL